MRYRKLPLRLRLKVEEYYEHRFHHKLFDEDIILNELSKALREVRNTSSHILLTTSYSFTKKLKLKFTARFFEIKAYEGWFF